VESNPGPETTFNMVNDAGVPGSILWHLIVDIPTDLTYESGVTIDLMELEMYSQASTVCPTQIFIIDADAYETEGYAFTNSGFSTISSSVIFATTCIKYGNLPALGELKKWKGGPHTLKHALWLGLFWDQAETTPNMTLSLRIRWSVDEDEWETNPFFAARNTRLQTVSKANSGWMSQKARNQKTHALNGNWDMEDLAVVKPMADKKMGKAMSSEEAENLSRTAPELTLGDSATRTISEAIVNPDVAPNEVGSRKIIAAIQWLLREDKNWDSEDEKNNGSSNDPSVPNGRMVCMVS